MKLLLKICMENIIQEKTRKNLIASSITIAVIALLFILGPAEAFIISLGAFSNANPTQGEIVSTTAEITINTNERMPLPNPVELYINGNKVCQFKVTGQVINCNSGITIALVSSSDSFGYGYGYNFGYGYGYNNGYGYGYGYNQGYTNSKFVYKISLDTSKLTAGQQKLELKIDTGAKTYLSGEKIMTIQQPQTNNNGGGGGRETQPQPEEQEPSNLPIIPLTDGSQVPNGETPSTTPDEQTEQTKGILSRITGAFIGTLGPVGSVVVILFILGAIGGAITLSLRKRKSN